MFDINITEEAEKDLKKITKKDTEIILKKIYSIKKNPLHFIERLSGVNLWKLRIGDYRVVMMIDTKNEIINVIKIGHRKNIYKRL